MNLTPLYSLLNFPFDSEYHFAHNDFSNAAFGKIQTIASKPTLHQVIFLNKRETQIDVGGCVKMGDQRR